MFPKETLVEKAYNQYRFYINVSSPKPAPPTFKELDSDERNAWMMAINVVLNYMINVKHYFSIIRDLVITCSICFVITYIIFKG